MIEVMFSIERNVYLLPLENKLYEMKTAYQSLAFLCFIAMVGCNNNVPIQDNKILEGRIQLMFENNFYYDTIILSTADSVLHHEIISTEYSTNFASFVTFKKAELQDITLRINSEIYDLSPYIDCEEEPCLTIRKVENELIVITRSNFSPLY